MCRVAPRRGRELNRKCDVCIVGGGLAGLALARQLRMRSPALDIAVIEHRGFPVPEATHKVGESTVEVAAHYLAHDLGLRQHLEQAQLRKFGLRLFFRGAKASTDLATYDELGASRPFPIPTYQLDRGRLENHLAESWRDAGGTLLDGTTVRSIDVVPGKHRVVARDAAIGTETTLTCRYLVDASGRRGWLRRQCGLSRDARHHHHAVWFRVAGQLDVDEMGSDSAWRSRCHGLPRRLSTNHFTGPGYWLWLIPLASGPTSVGVVFDPTRIPERQVRQRDGLLRWLDQEHPQLAQRLASCEVLDSHVLRNYAIGCREVFSDAGWMTTGDAGVFTDPFYSPGGDFIALANTYITELIAGRQPDSVRDYQRQFQSFFVSTLALYRGQYAGFGDRDLMLAKTLWDYAFYWSILAKVFFSHAFTDPAFMRACAKPLFRAAARHAGMQSVFRERAKLGRREGGGGAFYDQRPVPLFQRLQDDLLHGDGTVDRLTRNADHLAAVEAGVRGLLDSAAGLRSLEGVPGFE